jgi:acyl carrier protein
MNRETVGAEIRALLDGVLQLEGRAKSFGDDTGMLGAIPEFDSAAVVAVLMAIEENFGIVVEDDEISAETFETVGSLVDFVAMKCGATA